MELTQQHQALLQTALNREDGLLLRPERLVGAALRRMADRLVAGGVAETVPAGQGEPYWFKGAAQEPTGLRITQAGRTLLSGEREQGSRPATRERAVGEGAAERSEGPEQSRADGTTSAPAAAIGRAFRPGTKRAMLVELLRRENGATLEVLADALGWQPHTVRAALTRLRQDGVKIDRVRGEGGTAYRALGDASPETRLDAGAGA